MSITRKDGGWQCPRDLESQQKGFCTKMEVGEGNDLKPGEHSTARSDTHGLSWG